MKDFINIYDNALSSEQSKQIIEHFESYKEYDYKENEYKKEERECATVGMVFDKTIYEPTNNIIRDVLLQYTGEYIKDNAELNSVCPFQPYRGFNVQRYEPNQCYHLSHTENNGVYYERMMVWTIYLNTVTDGGGTYYPQYWKTIDAVEGRLVIWPAYWTHFHHGVVSKTQTKYIATGWYIYNHINQ